MSRIEGLAVFGEPLFLLFYGLDYFAAFAGCSAETEASFDTIVFLAEKMDELGCGTIFTIKNSDHKIAQTIIDNTKAKNQNIAEMNSWNKPYHVSVKMRKSLPFARLFRQTEPGRAFILSARFS